jgi:hypothetical protein
MSHDPAVVDYLRQKYLGIAEQEDRGAGSISGGFWNLLPFIPTGIDLFRKATGLGRKKRKASKGLNDYRIAKQCYELSNPGSSNDDFQNAWCKKMPNTKGCFSRSYRDQHPYDSFVLPPAALKKPTKRQYQMAINKAYKDFNNANKYKAVLKNEAIANQIQQQVENERNIDYTKVGTGRRRKSRKRSHRGGDYEDIQGYGIRAGSRSGGIRAGGIRAGVLVGGDDYEGLGRRKSRHYSNPWIEHVRDYWDKHPNLSYKQAMQKARASY